MAPVFTSASTFWPHHISAVSSNDALTMPPTPVRSRRCSIDSAPMTAHMPVPWSHTEGPARIGGSSGPPLIAQRPLYAWISGSKPGRIAIGPVWPNAEISQ